MAYAQGFTSNISVGLGFEGIFPASTFTKAVTEANLENGGTQTTTESVGIVADGRYDFGRHSALGVAVTVNRNSQIFYNNDGQGITSVKSNNGELIGTYIFRLPSNERVKPYAMFGGGLIRFSPVNQGFTTATPQADTKPAFAYGFGTDIKVSDHLAVRLQYRGLLYTEPDFKLSSTDPSVAFGTGLRTHVPEPSIQLVYHF